MTPLLHTAARLSVAAVLLGPGADTLLGRSDTASTAAQAQADGVAPEPTAEARAKARERLARGFAQRARNLLQRDQIYIGMLESADALIRRAIDLNPDNPFIWRIALDLSTAMEDGDAGAVALQSQALRRLTELEPDNEVIRLRRLLNAVDTRQTAEERVAALSRLLEPASIAAIGRPVAARLAFDLAVLLRRTGDIAGFERELLHAVDLDPSFPEATELAAGYFRMRAPGAVEDAQAMRLAMLANPVRTPAALGLAALCMEHAAYRAAAAVLNIEAELLAVTRPDPVFDGVLSDLQLALWGAGRHESAFAVLVKRQRMLDTALLAELDRDGAILSLEDRQKTRMPISPELAAGFAAMASAIGRPDADIAIANAEIAYETRIEGLNRLEEGDRAAIDAEMASARLQGALVVLWLGGKADKAEDWISAARRTAPLSEDAEARFAGWVAFRRGDLAAAAERLAPIAERDLPAQLGLALVREAQGDRRAAARGLLAVARGTPATAMGIWSRDRLRSMLGQPDLAVIEGAELVEAAAALPEEFTRLMQKDSRKVLLRIVSRETTVNAWDPLRFEIELTNVSGWPLAISSEGPLLDTMTLTASVNAAGRPPSLPPFAIVALNRRFVLPKDGTMTVPIDASLTDAAILLRDDPVSGAFLSVHGILNWRTTASGLEAGPLGVEVESTVVHVQGVRLERAWIEARLAELADRSRVPDPETIAMLAHALKHAARRGADLDPSVREALAPVGAAIADAATRLWPEARAWLAFATPHAATDEGADALEGLDEEAAARVLGGGVRVPELAALTAVLREDTTPITRLAWIAVRSLQPEDPVLIATESMEPKELADFARTYRSWLLDVQEERRRSLNLR